LLVVGVVRVPVPPDQPANVPGVTLATRRAQPASHKTAKLRV